MRQTRQAVPLLLATLLITGCGSEADNGFCATHGRDHWRHSDQVALLDIRYSVDGVIDGRVSLPVASVGDASGVLATAGKVFATDAGCVAEQPAVAREGERLVGEYRLQCAGEEPLRAFSIPLFDQLEALEELEVTMATPAVTKHFLIHRECERALFNIAQEESGS